MNNQGDSITTTHGLRSRAILPLISEAKMASSYYNQMYADTFRYLDSLEARPITTRRHIREVRNLNSDPTPVRYPAELFKGFLPPSTR